MGGNRHQAWCRLRSESVCPLYRRQEKQLTVALVDQEGLPIAQAKLKVQGPDWAEYKAQLVVTDKYKGELGKDTRLPSCLRERKGSRRYGEPDAAGYLQRSWSEKGSC